MQTENVVRKVNDSLLVEVVNESPYGPPSRDGLTRYQREEVLGDAKFQLTSRHGVITTLDGQTLASVLYGANGGASGVHQHSLAILDDRVFLAVGPFIVCFALHGLATHWVQQVDDATCFGVHICPDQGSLLSHGEMEISRLTFAGDILWRSGGPDIFTGDLSFGTSAVLVEDFNGDTLSFDLETGHSVVKRRPTSR